MPASTDTTPLRPRGEALEMVKGEPREVTPSPGDFLGPEGDLGPRTLTGLLRVHPLMSFFCWLADRQYPDSHRADTRVARLRERDRAFYWVCVTVDTVLVILAALGLLAAAAYAVYKTIVL
jgi:hypothetical protein